MMQKKILDRFHNFIDNLKKEDNISILYHPDADGLCSAVIIERYLSKKNFKIKLRLWQERSTVYITKSSFKKLRQNKINKLIIVDVPIDRCLKEFKYAERFFECLIIDHHELMNDLNTEKTVHINTKDSAVCTSKIVYQLFPLRNSDWLSATGIIADTYYKKHKLFIDKVLKKYGIKKQKNISNTSLGILGSYVVAAYALKKMDEAYLVFLNAKTPKEALNSALKEYYNLYNLELERCMSEIESTKEFVKGIVLYEVKSRLVINSPLASNITCLHPHKTYFIIQKNKNHLNVSARRRDGKIDLNKMLFKFGTILGAKGGGGHKQASGMVIKASQKEKLKKLILQSFKNKKI